MTTTPKKYKELVPLYLNGRLSESEIREFEVALEKYPEILEEVTDFSEIMDTYKHIEHDIPEPASNLFHRTCNNINLQEKKESVAKKERIGIYFFLKNLFFSKKTYWAVAGLQTVIIVFMFSGVFQSNNEFNTLAVPKSECVNCFMLNTVFHADAMEKEIRSLLIDTGGVIIKGPDKDGLYIIRIEERGKTHKNIIQELKKSNIIRHVTERY